MATPPSTNRAAAKQLPEVLLSHVFCWNFGLVARLRVCAGGCVSVGVWMCLWVCAAAHACFYLCVCARVCVRVCVRVCTWLCVCARARARARNSPTFSSNSAAEASRYFWNGYLSISMINDIHHKILRCVNRIHDECWIGYLGLIPIY